LITRITRKGAMRLGLSVPMMRIVVDTGLRVWLRGLLDGRVFRVRKMGRKTHTDTVSGRA
jgi:hypothetical protein